MTSDTASYKYRAHEAVTADSMPACPRCGNLCGRLARICVDCGAKLYDDLFVQAAPRREETQTTEGSVS